MSNLTTCLLGYSGHAYVVAEAALQMGIQLNGYADKSASRINPFKLTYLGSEHSDEFKGWHARARFVLGIGDNKTRMGVAKFIRFKGYDLVTIVHPDSSVSKYATIKSGVFIARNVAINPLCLIGEDVIINTSASIDHECKIGTGSHIAPGAVLSGNVTIGKGVFVGANAVIKQGVTIEDYAIIGAGSVVLDNITANATVIGNPAKYLYG